MTCLPKIAKKGRGRVIAPKTVIYNLSTPVNIDLTSPPVFSRANLLTNLSSFTISSAQGVKQIATHRKKHKPSFCYPDQSLH